MEIDSLWMGSCPVGYHPDFPFIVFFGINELLNDIFSLFFLARGNTGIKLTQNVSIVSVDNVPENNVIDCEGNSRGFSIVNTSAVLNIVVSGLTLRGCRVPVNYSITLPSKKKQ
jgi:hypothetical protein